MEGGPVVARLASTFVCLSALLLGTGAQGLGQTVRVGFFDVDASPPPGSPLAYDPCVGVEEPLHCRGIVVVGAGEPIVLCAIDWLGVANESHLEFRRQLAQAVGTTESRVAVHAIHQHDAPRCDFSTERLLAHSGLHHQFFDGPLARRVMARAGQAAARAAAQAQEVTHIGMGLGRVERVASNRRILGPDGKVKYIRWTACKDPLVRSMPVGTVDPVLRLVAFYHHDRCLGVLTYFATHPQSYYRTGLANPDFPGLARKMRDEQTGVMHVHFNGAGGNIGAGKWNDGARENRPVLARRLAEGMARAWENQKRVPLSPSDVQWKTLPVRLPPAPHLELDRLMARVQDPQEPPAERLNAASHLVWLQRCLQGDAVDVSCLALGPVRILHLPGELFVEYQLAAQRMRPDLFVCMAAYGDYGPGYIGTEIAYRQGGYETSDRASRVAPEVEGVLIEAIEQLLRD